MQSASIVLLMAYALLIAYVFLTKGRVEPELLFVGIGVALGVYTWRRAA